MSEPQLSSQPVDPYAAIWFDGRLYGVPGNGHPTCVPKAAIAAISEETGKQAQYVSSERISRGSVCSSCGRPLLPSPTQNKQNETYSGNSPS